MTEEAFSKIAHLYAFSVETTFIHNPETMSLTIKMRGRADGLPSYLGTSINAQYIEYATPDVVRLTMKSMTRSLLQHMSEQLQQPEPLIDVATDES